MAAGRGGHGHLSDVCGQWRSGPMSETSSRQANRRTARRLVLAAVAMFGFGFALWPLYNVFCEVTGLNGKTGRVAEAEALQMGASDEAAEARYVTVLFDANVDPKLPWQFQPKERQMRVQVGEMTDALYLAFNRDDDTIVGQAVPSVAPGEASRHFSKIECFCFTEQTLAGGETQEMPVNFIVGPDLPEDIEVLTLSYTFYRNDAATDAVHGMAQHDHGPHGPSSESTE